MAGHLTLRVRVIAAFAVILTALAGLGGWSAWRLWQMGAVSNRIIAENYDSVVAAQQMKESLERQDSAVLFFLAGEHARAAAQLAEHRARFADALGRASRNITEAEEPGVIDDITRRFAAYTQTVDRLLSRAPADAAAYFAEAEPPFNALRADCDRLLTLNQEAMRRKAVEAASIARTNFLSAVALTAALTLAGLLLSRAMAGSILRARQVLIENVRHLEAADRVKSEFIARASHELRTPLMSLQLGVHLLQEDAATLSSKQMELVRICREEADRLARLSSELLDLSKLESGEGRPRAHRQAVATLVHGCVEPLRLQVESSGVRLRVEVPPGLADVAVDRAQIERVMANLLSNAARATPAGGEIVVSAAQGAGTIDIAVRDTGCGIAAADLARIFEPFVQVPGRPSGAAGLGLALSRRIVESHGGTLTAVSTPGGGSTFTMSLPPAGPAAA